MGIASAIPTVELTDMRAEVEALTLDTTCTLQTPTPTSVKGSWSNSFANTHENIACRLSGANRDLGESALGDVASARVSFILTLPWNQAIAVEDRVIVNSKTYEVVTVLDDTSFRTARRVTVRRVD